MTEHALLPHTGTAASKWIEICRDGPLTPLQVRDKMAGGHSVFSPSGGEMTMTCSESLYLNAIAEDSGSYEAAEGTVAHSMAELWINTGERPDHMIGEEIEVKGGFVVEVTDEMLGFCGDFVGLCKNVGEGAEISRSEMYASTSHLTPIPDQGGTMDFAAIFPQRLVIVDLKYGKEKVLAYYEDDHGNRQINKQLGAYGSAVFREYDWLYNFQEIEIIISQPRLPEPVSRVVITRQELLEFEDMAREAWAKCWQPREKLTRTPSVKGCRWCAVRGNCSALYLFLEKATDVFSSYSDDGDIIDEVTFEDEELIAADAKVLDVLAPSPFPKTPDPKELSTKAMAKLLRYRKLMENFFNSIERELLDRAISLEEDIPWWKLVESRSQRRMVDDVPHIVEAIGEWGLTRKQLYKTVMLSPAELEREVHTLMNKGKPKRGKGRISLEKVKALIEEAGLTVRPTGQKTLAPASDSRRELPKDGDVFDVWTSE